MYLREQKEMKIMFIQLINYALLSCILFFFKLIPWPFKVNGIFTTGLIGTISPFICEKQFLLFITISKWYPSFSSLTPVS